MLSVWADYVLGSLHLVLQTFLPHYPGPAFRFLKNPHQSIQVDFLGLVELKAANQIDMPPSDRGSVLDNLDRLLIAAGLLLREYARGDHGVVVDHRVGDEPRALVPNLLLSLGTDAQFSRVHVSDGASKPMVRFAAVQRFLHALAQRDVVDEIQNVERAADAIQLP